MSQHDMDIANASGATVRADVSAALKALASTSIGNSAPPTPYTGQSWVDNNTPSATVWTWFVYDGADWIALAYIDSVNNVVTPVTVTFASLDANFIADATLVAAATGDLVLGMDASDSNNTKSFLAPYSGTYSPGLTGVLNVDSAGTYTAQYTRVGNVVTVSGRLDVDATSASASTQVGINLPIASNFGALEDCGGTMHPITTGIAGTAGGVIYADAANNRAQLEFIPTVATNTGYGYIFQYLII